MTLQAANIAKDLLSHAPSIRAYGVEALVLGGSFGQGRADENSDIDVFLIAPDHKIRELCETGIRQIASLIAEVVLFRGPVYVANFGHSFTALTAADVLYQFNLNSPSALRPNPMASLPCMIIFDDQNTYQKFIEDSARTITAPEDLYATSATFFWLRAVLATRALRRGEFWQASRYLVDMRDQMLLLLRILKGPLPLNPSAPAKAIERDIGDGAHLQEIWRAAPRHSDEVWEALHFAMNWYFTQAARLPPSFDKRAGVASAAQQIRDSFQGRGLIKIPK